MPAIEVASLFGTLDLRDNATGTLRQFNSGLDGVEQRLQSFGQGLSNTGRAISTLTAPLVAIGVVGVNVAASFQDSMAEIAARTGLTGDALNNIRQTALQLGADTTFSAQEALQAFLQLSTGGMNAEDSLTALPAVLDAAAASGSNLGQTADYITDAMAAFRLPANRARQVVNTFSRAAGASSATMEGLFQGLANVGPVAAQFGISLEDTVAMLALLNDQGVKGAEAGTALRSMFTNMSNDTDTVSGAWEQLGSSMFDVNGEMRPMANIISDISSAMDGMTSEQRTQLLHDLAGSYGQTALSVLLAGDSIGEMTTKMDASADAATVAAARTDTFNGRMEALRGSVEAAMTNAFTPFMDDVLTPMAEKLIDVVNNVGAWTAANPQATQSIIQLVGGVALLGAGMFVTGGIISNIATILGGLRTVAIALGLTGLLPLVGIIALIGGMFLAYQNNILGFRDRIEELRTTIGNALTTLQQFSYILQTIGTNPQVVANAVSAEFQAGSFAGPTNQGRSAGVQRLGSQIGTRGVASRFMGNSVFGLPGMAGGGNFPAGWTGIVGEKGPELVSFGKSGSVTSNSDMRRMGGGDTYNISVMMPAEALRSPEAARARGADFGSKLAEEMRAKGYQSR